VKWGGGGDSGDDVEADKKGFPLPLLLLLLLVVVVDFVLLLLARPKASTPLPQLNTCPATLRATE
jgi:hypothetical protein